MGDSLSSLSVKELKQVENRLEKAISRIRSKKVYRATTYYKTFLDLCIYIF